MNTPARDHRDQSRLVRIAPVEAERDEEQHPHLPACRREREPEVADSVDGPTGDDQARARNAIGRVAAEPRAQKLHDVKDGPQERGSRLIVRESDRYYGFKWLLGF